MCLHVFFSFLPTPTLFLYPSPSLFQHLCWVHARASDKALCVPSFGNLPCFSSWLPAPPSWKPHNFLPFSLTIPPRPLKASRRTHQVQTETPRSCSTHISPGKVRLCLSARLWEEGGDGAKVSSHCIMRLAILPL